MRKKYNTNHTFAVCAYKESSFLEECVESLVEQSTPTNIIVCTSTPCAYIENIAKKYDLPYYVRDGKSDIQDDWNFACEMADTDWITVAHQDDKYHKHYVEEMLKKIEEDKDALMYMSGYAPIKHGQVSTDINCKIRRLLRTPMKWKCCSSSIFWKKRTLCLGNSICCPAVTYNAKQIGKPIFTSPYKFNLDWDTYLKLAEMKGRFLYTDKSLTYYRVHEEATTMEFIKDNGRYREDSIMFNKFWPKWVTKCIMKFYTYAYQTYSE